MTDAELKLWTAEADRRLREELAKATDKREQKLLKAMLKEKGKRA